MPLKYLIVVILVSMITGVILEHEFGFYNKLIIWLTLGVEQSSHKWLKTLLRFR